MEHVWIVARREVHDPLDLLRRYCGLPWSGGEPETWSFKYFDEVPLMAGPDRLTVTDVLACGSLLPQIQPKWYSWLYERGLDEIGQWARHLPRDLDLSDASHDDLYFLFALQELKGAPLSLTSKLAYRLRPRLVPMYDATIGKRYDLIHGMRGTDGWPHFVTEYQLDLQRNYDNLRSASEAVSSELAEASWHQREPLFGARDWHRDPLPMTRILDIVLYVDDQLRRRENDARRRGGQPFREPR